jgi:flagellar hook-length control protein FliK
MGLTVIPASAAGLLPANVASTGVGSEAIAGEFAALLSGELLGLMANVATAGEELIDNPRKTASSADQSATGEDPSLFASLFGHLEHRPASQPGAPRAGFDDAEAMSSRSANGGIGSELRDSLASARRADIAAQQLAERSAPAGRDPATLAGAVEKNNQPLSFGSQLAASLRSSAANIAGESRGDSLPPASALTGQGITHPAQGLEKLPNGEQRPVVNAHLHSAAWPQQFGDKVVWLARNDQQSAQLTINPPQLGPVQISLNLSGDQASIVFASPHAEVRQAIESAMPQLKEMLASAGISLGQSNVGANLSQQPDNSAFADANGKRSADENAILAANDNAANAAGSPVLHRGRGLVDLFA